MTRFHLLLSLALSSLLLLFVRASSPSSTNICNKDIAVGSFVFRIPSPNVPSYQYYYNGSDIKYMVDLSDIVFDVTGSIGNLPSWNWNWDCGANICPYSELCSFTFYGYSKKSPMLNVTMDNTVTPFGLKFTVTLSGPDAGALISQNRRLDYLFGFKCTQGACGDPVSLSSLLSAGLYSNSSTADFSVVSVLGNSATMSNSSGDVCGIDSSANTKGGCGMSNFTLSTDSNHEIDISFTWDDSMNVTAVTLDPTITVSSAERAGVWAPLLVMGVAMSMVLICL